MPIHLIKVGGGTYILLWSVPTRRETKCSLQQNKKCSAISSMYKWHTKVLQRVLNIEKIIERLLFIFSILLYYKFYAKSLWLPVSDTNHFVVGRVTPTTCATKSVLPVSGTSDTIFAKYIILFICRPSCATCSANWQN